MRRTLLRTRTAIFSIPAHLQDRPGPRHQHASWDSRLRLRGGYTAVGARGYAGHPQECGTEGRGTLKADGEPDLEDRVVRRSEQVLGALDPARNQGMVGRGAKRVGEATAEMGRGRASHAGRRGDVER